MRKAFPWIVDVALSLAHTHMVFFCELETHSAFYISLVLVREETGSADPTGCRFPPMLVDLQ